MDIHKLYRLFTIRLITRLLIVYGYMYIIDICILLICI